MPRGSAAATRLTINPASTLRPGDPFTHRHSVAGSSVRNLQTLFTKDYMLGYSAVDGRAALQNRLYSVLLDDEQRGKSSVDRYSVVAQERKFLACAYLAINIDSSK